MSRSIALIKGRKPTLNISLMRHRLFSALDKAHQSASLTWISALAGSGKTTLVSSYLTENKRDYFWYHCDDSDNDLASFFHHLGIIYQQKYPRRKNQLPHLHPEYQLDVTTFGKNFFKQLFSTISTPGLLVFDDFHYIETTSSLHAILRDSLDYLPDGLSLIVTSRYVPPSAYARLRVSKMLIELPTEQLAFTYQETTDLVKLVALKTSPKNTVLKNWYEKTQGWATGLMLLLEQARQNQTSFVIEDHIAQEYIFDYFSGEYFDSLTQATKEILVVTSLLKSVVGHFCDFRHEY